MSARTSPWTLGMWIALGAASVLPLAAQGDSQAARVRNLNNQILQIYGQLQQASAAGAAQLRSQAAPLLAERLGALSALMEENANEALSLAFPANLTAQLAAAFPQSAGQLETHGTWSGEVESWVEDGENLASHRTLHRLKAGAEVLGLFFAAGAEPPGLHSGHIVVAQGVRAGGNVAAAGGNITGQSSTAGAACSTFGAQNVVAILVNFQDYKLSSSMDQELVKGILWGNAYSSKQNSPNWSVDDFWQQNSDGQTGAPFSGGKVAGPYTLNGNYNTNSQGQSYCDSTGIRNAAIAAADPDVNFQNYSRVMIVMPPNGACGWAGLGSLGCWSNSAPQDGAFTASIAWQRSDQMSNRSSGVRLSTHELGHNLTLHHASSRDYGSEALGPLSEYGDLFSTMGSWNFGFYSAHHAKQQLGWLQQTTNWLQVESNGTYSIQAYESRPAGLKALRVRRGTGNNAWLWIEYRKNQGIYDSQLNSQVYTGALIHYEDSSTGTKTHLLDFTTSTNSFNDPALAVGQMWVDPYSNVSISVDSIAGDMLTVTVNYGAVPCNEANPTVTLSPASSSVQAGNQASFTVSVKNNDSSGCSSSTFGLSSSQPSGWTSSLTPASLTLAPGATSTASLKETPPEGTTPASYTVSGTAAKPGYAGTGSATLNVTAPPPPLSASLDVPNNSYARKATIPISVTALGGSSPASGATVQFSLLNQSAKKPSPTTKTLTTGTNGVATWNYSTNTAGTYTVSATVTWGGQTVTTNSDTFTVQ
jgi:M6 family metalloprotease-like protein